MARRDIKPSAATRYEEMELTDKDWLEEARRTINEWGKTQEDFLATVVARALKKAFERGRSGAEPVTPPVSTLKRRTRTPVAVVEVDPAPRVIRRRTRG